MLAAESVELEFIDVTSEVNVSDVAYETDAVVEASRVNVNVPADTVGVVPLNAVVSLFRFFDVQVFDCKAPRDKRKGS